MKSSIATLLLILAVVSPSMAADLKDDLVAMEKSSWVAWGNRDAKAFGDLMTDDAVSVFVGGEVAKGREKILADLSSHTCTLKSFDFADTNLRQLSPDIAILTYTATQDVTCEGEKGPPKIFATSVYVRQGGKWRWTNYQETAL
jgi:uncharacterized protein (TIGR02246 family)